MSLSTIRGRRPFIAPLKRRKHKDKNQRKKQKRGFPIKDFGMTEGVDFLNASIITLFVTPE